jgi:hypothetical protein
MFKIFKYILDLQRENILLRRAIVNSALMLHKREAFFTLRECKDKDISLLFKEVHAIISDCDKVDNT